MTSSRSLFNRVQRKLHEKCWLRVFTVLIGELGEQRSQGQVLKWNHKILSSHSLSKLRLKVLFPGQPAIALPSLYVTRLTMEQTSPMGTKALNDTPPLGSQTTILPGSLVQGGPEV